jgi:putative exporter of polyketide antibiotics
MKGQESGNEQLLKVIAGGLCYKDLDEAREAFLRRARSGLQLLGDLLLFLGISLQLVALCVQFTTWTWGCFLFFLATLQ